MTESAPTDIRDARRQETNVPSPRTEQLARIAVVYGMVFSVGALLNLLSALSPPVFDLPCPPEELYSFVALALFTILVTVYMAHQIYRHCVTTRKVIICLFMLAIATILIIRLQPKSRPHFCRPLNMSQEEMEAQRKALSQTIYR